MPKKVVVSFSPPIENAGTKRETRLTGHPEFEAAVAEVAGVPVTRRVCGVHVGLTFEPGNFFDAWSFRKALKKANSALGEPVDSITVKAVA